nr:MAG TPA: hypothetical protein [Caudoviricetes sp.]
MLVVPEAPRYVRLAAFVERSEVIRIIWNSPLLE